MRASLSIVSIALNAVLLGAVIVIWRSDNEPARASSSPLAPSTTAAHQDPAKLFAAARSQGVSEEMAYHVALVSARAAVAITVPDEYWKPTPLQSAALREAEFKSAVATRELLIKSFGPEARNQPAFAEVFQPLRQRFGFLSPDKQVLLQQILFETAEGALGRNGPKAQARSQRLTRIRALLDDKEFQEYQLRESPLAGRLANSGMDFTEAEFRAVYDVVAATDVGNTRADPLRTAIPAIKRVLSPERFAELERAQDPTYRWLRSGAVRFGASQDTTVAAYELIRDTDERVLELERTTPAQTLQARADLIATRDRQLETLLGEEMFNYIAPRLQTGAKPGPRWAGDPATASIPIR